eukprot:Plantae.Rhodophyta-Purpureofilum_apyrenoidigerum.ctg4346.p1 GENE.Plantae.Rhodophyta-Purpureofilum_apyrenoidigerum.ctg4346~~Plantae.Rhodophyta-Purpureofilum_apyrenoidigerum.ctg4346.p1  ORF type:complete len:326 (+),score=63.22 Plantae.Rhodophyta-Purpureofilum_apyrenoidigerum.ctg4346:69-1046(+)
MSLGDREKLVKHLNSYKDRVNLYEDEQKQEQARAVIPEQELREYAAKRLHGEVHSGEEVKEDQRANVQFRCPDAALAKELLRWFKCSLFRWVDTLPCPECNGKTVKGEAAIPSEDDLRFSATRVEIHNCETCGTEQRFPRFNDPAKLLETRRGRCGEWANAFTLCCRAVELDARLVLDWTDHVWTEIWSSVDQRWVHADSCESVLDEPLIYESGWGKKLSYIIAFHRSGVTDVTRRYTNKFDEVLSRRTVMGEDELAALIGMLNDEQINSASEDIREEEIRARQLREQEELHRGQIIKSGLALPGRISGAEEWKAARGELGHDPS